MSEKILGYMLVGGGSSKTKCRDMLIEIQKKNINKCIVFESYSKTSPEGFYLSMMEGVP